MSKNKPSNKKKKIIPKAECLSSNGLIYRLDKPPDDEMDFMPMSLLTAVTIELADYLEDTDLPESIKRLFASDLRSDQDTIAKELVSILKRALFVTCPGTTPYLGKTKSADLFLAFTNDYILWQALGRNLIYGDRLVTIVIPEIPKVKDTLEFVVHCIARVWIKLTLSLAIDYMHDIWDGIKEGGKKPEGIICPYPLWAITKDGKKSIKTEDAFIGSQVDIAGRHKKSYKLWLRVFLSGTFEFIFLPLFEKDQDDYSYRMKLLSLIMEVEQDIKRITRSIKKAWKQFIDEPRWIALQNEEAFPNWFDDALSELGHIITKSKSLSRALAIVDTKGQTAEIKKLVKKLKKLLKNDIPQVIQWALMQASREIGYLFKATRSSRNREYASDEDRKNRALGYFQNFPHRFKYITEQDISKIPFDDDNAIRNARRKVLPCVAKRLKWPLKGWQIEKFLKQIS